MAGFLNKLRSNASGANPAAGSSPAKKDANHHTSTPLEKLLLDAGPIRNDGSDKFFGMENFGNTCYCNSIVQCLYYSVPFREQVISYPKRSPLESRSITPEGQSKININAAASPSGLFPILSPKLKTPAGPTSARNPGGPAPPQKLDDKESPEYKKKQAMLAGPLLPMNYENAAAYGMTESLFTSLKDIFEAIVTNESRTGVVSPTRFLEVLRRENEMFRTAMHQDAHEFLNIVLNEVVANVEADSKREDLSKLSNGKGDYSNVEKAIAAAGPNTTGTRTPERTGWVHELFEGTLTSETKCLTCENVSQRDEAFLDLSVDLDQHSSVTSCLRKFSEEEMLCERNKFHCDQCGGLQEAEKRMKIKRLPKILALHLKRFKYTEDLQRLQKLFHRVVYPYHLRLFNTTDDAEDPDRLYELYAVVVHIGGGPYHGHYVSIIKTKDRGWLLFDDEMVEPVDRNYVRNFFGERPGLACAYVLFYQETTLEAVKKEQEAEGLVNTAQGVTVAKTTPALALKTNGIHQQSIIAPVQHALSPSSPNNDSDRLNILDRSATAPAVVSPSHTPLGPGASSAVASPALPSLSPKKSDVQSKKERAKEEKERRAAEKAVEREQEKADKLRQKNSSLKRKEYEKQQAAEVKAAVEASKLSKAEEDRRAGSESSSGGKENGNAISLPFGGSATLSRFRQTSKSIKKPKFWGSKESRDASKGNDSAIDDGPDPFVSLPVGAEVNQGGTVQMGTFQPVEKVEKVEKERKKSFLGLRKKKSGLLL